MGHLKMAMAMAKARGLLLEGDGDTGQTVTPAHTAAHKHKQRIREIAEELSLWGVLNDSRPPRTDSAAETSTPLVTI